VNIGWSRAVLLVFISALLGVAAGASPCFGETVSDVPLALSAQVGWLGKRRSVQLSGETITCVAVGPGSRHDTVSGKPTQAQWAEFRDTLNNLGVWRWEQEYFNDGVLDGMGWSLSIKYATQHLESHGSNSFPTRDGSPSKGAQETAQFIAFRKAISQLVPGCAF
jgi:hypothetical protein